MACSQNLVRNFQLFMKQLNLDFEKKTDQQGGFSSSQVEGVLGIPLENDIHVEDSIKVTRPDTKKDTWFSLQFGFLDPVITRVFCTVGADCFILGEKERLYGILRLVDQVVSRWRFATNWAAPTTPECRPRSAR